MFSCLPHQIVFTPAIGPISTEFARVFDFDMATTLVCAVLVGCHDNNIMMSRLKDGQEPDEWLEIKATLIWERCFGWVPKSCIPLVLEKLQLMELLRLRSDLTDEKVVFQLDTTELRRFILTLPKEYKIPEDSEDTNGGH